MTDHLTDTQKRYQTAARATDMSRLELENALAKLSNALKGGLAEIERLRGELIHNAITGDGGFSPKSVRIVNDAMRTIMGDVFNAVMYFSPVVAVAMGAINARETLVLRGILSVEAVGETEAE